MFGEDEFFPKTGLSATCVISKDNGAYVSCTNTLVEIGVSGHYYLDLTATEMNADFIIVDLRTPADGTTVAIIRPSTAVDPNEHPTSGGPVVRTIIPQSPVIRTTIPVEAGVV
jgi:hypothetical protein